ILSWRLSSALYMLLLCPGPSRNRTAYANPPPSPVLRTGGGLFTSCLSSRFLRVQWSSTSSVLGTCHGMLTHGWHRHRPWRVARCRAGQVTSTQPDRPYVQSQLLSSRVLSRELRPLQYFATRVRQLVIALFSAFRPPSLTCPKTTSWFGYQAPPLPVGGGAPEVDLRSPG